MPDEMKLRRALDGFHDLLIYVDRFNQILSDIKNGRDIDEIDFSAIYAKPKLDELNEVSDIITIISKIIENILKIIYSPSRVLEKRWIKDLDKYRNRAIGHLQWDVHGDKEIGHHSKEDLQFPYMNAIALYKEDMINHPGLYSRLKEIPGKCPWSLNELIELDIENLTLILKECV